MKIETTFDPLKKFQKHICSELLEACGLLPHWVVNPEFSHIPLKEAMETQYGFPMIEMEKSTISETGVMRYPEDPDMYPMIKIVRGDETFYQYDYGVVAFVQNDGSSYVTRMD